MFGTIRLYLWAGLSVAFIAGSFRAGQIIERQGWQADALKAAESLRVIESQKDTRNHAIGQQSASKQAAEVRYVDRLIKEIVAMPVSADCTRLPDDFVVLYNRAANGEQVSATSAYTRVDARANRERSNAGIGYNGE